MGGSGLRVLVTDGNYKHALGAVRSLSSAGFQVEVLGGTSCYSAVSKHCRGGLSASLTDITREECKEFGSIDLSKYDVLMPIGAESVYWASRNRDQFPEQLGIALAAQSAIESSFDKLHTSQLAQTLGIAIPLSTTWDPNEPSEFPIQDLRFPIVVKPSNELAPGQPLYANNSNELGSILKGINRKQTGDFQYLIQEFVRGEGVGFFAVYDRGECRQHFMHRRVREFPASGGSSACAESIYERDLYEAGRQLLDSMNWHGVAMVEFKRQRDSERLVLMEINPKFWGSLDLAISSGVDFPRTYCELALGREVQSSMGYKVGLRFHWPLEGDFQHALSRPKSLPAILFDLCSPRVRSNIWLSDIRPSLQRVWRGLAAIGRSVPVVGEVIKIGSRTCKIGFRQAVARSWSELSGIPMIKYSRLAPNIYVGAQHRRMGKRKLAKLGVNGSLNLRSEFDYMDGSYRFEHYLHLPVDEYSAPSQADLDDSVLFAKKITHLNGSVYIHCREGVSRAPTIAAALLIESGDSLEVAIEKLYAMRPFINILPIQMESLRIYASRQTKT